MLSRREMVGRLAAGTAAVCATGMARVSLASTRPETATRGQGEARIAADPTGPQIVDAEGPATSNTAAPWELLSPLAMGAPVANGWRAVGLTGVVDGSCVLTLQNQRGREHRVHLCRNDGSPEGLVYTDRFDLVVMNGGRGDLPTEEGLAQAVAAVAHVLATNERRRQLEPLIQGLLPQAERLSQYSGPVDRRLR